VARPQISQARNFELRGVCMGLAEDDGSTWKVAEAAAAERGADGIYRAGGGIACASEDEGEDEVIGHGVDGLGWWID
jgi:hypothetical protein